MKHTKEEIINALKVIKDECADHERCKHCPFGDDGDSCNLVDLVDTDSIPSEWKIAELPPPETWRALK